MHLFLLKKNVQIVDIPKKILELVLLQNFAGYPEDPAINESKNDPAFECLLEAEDVASQSTVSRFLE